MPTPLIHFEEVSKTFRRVRVLDGIDLDIALGERVALIGSNGAGKTTLIRCLLGEYVHQGSVRIDGLCPRRQRTTVLKQVGFVPQLPPPLKMPVEQLLHFAADLCGGTPQRMRDLAGRLGLDVDAVRSRPFVKLSGGMKQKLLIALALGREARVLVLDEPAANLDPEARKIFFDLLAERADSTTMLLSSHRLDEVSALVNRVVELDTGKIVLDDRVADDVALAGRFACRIGVKRAEPAFARAMQQWGFDDLGDGQEWSGEVAGADRLRFLGMTARYAALIATLRLHERTSGGA